MGKVIDLNTGKEPVEVVEAEVVSEESILNMMKGSIPPTPYYEVKNVLTNSIQEFSNELEDAINAGNQILQMGVVGDNHYALIVVASIV